VCLSGCCPVIYWYFIHGQLNWLFSTDNRVNFFRFWWMTPRLSFKELYDMSVQLQFANKHSMLKFSAFDWATVMFSTLVGMGKILCYSWKIRVKHPCMTWMDIVYLIESENGKGCMLETLLFPLKETSIVDSWSSKIALLFINFFLVCGGRVGWEPDYAMLACFLKLMVYYNPARS
jgi:hypothetical protein